MLLAHKLKHAYTASRPRRDCTLGSPGAFFHASSFAPKLLSGHTKGLAISSFQQLQTTGTQPSHSLLPQHKDLSSVSDTEMLSLPQRRGLSPALRLSQATRHPLPGLQSPENMSTLTELPWGAQEQQARKDASPGTAFKQEDHCRTGPQGFGLCNKLHNPVRDGDQALRAPFAWRHGTHPSVPHLLPKWEGQTPFPS